MNMADEIDDFKLCPCMHAFACDLSGVVSRAPSFGRWVGRHRVAVIAARCVSVFDNSQHH